MYKDTNTLNRFGPLDKLEQQKLGCRVNPKTVKLMYIDGVLEKREIMCFH